MIQPITISTRELTREYKQVFKKIRETKQPVIVTTQKKPQVAIINVSDLPKLQYGESNNSAKSLLKLVGIIPKNSGLPKDLSTNHDKYIWDE